MEQMKDSETSKLLISQISLGNSDAFSRFFELYSSKVFQFSRYFLRSRETCEEVVSDVFINIWQNKEKLAEVNHIDAYLYVLTRNKAYNYLDKISRVPEFISEIPVEIQADDANPEGILLTEELEHVIYSAIDDLPEKCRIIFLMSREDKLKYHEIAEILSISEKTVQAQIITALKKLHLSLKKYFYIFL
jgi:RNA polymerase sigma-70 factor (family 1)